MTTNNPFITVQDLAAMLNKPVRTIYAWRARGAGPRGYRIGKSVLFKAQDVDAWIEEHADPLDA